MIRISRVGTALLAKTAERRRRQAKHFTPRLKMRLAVQRYPRDPGYREVAAYSHQFKADGLSHQRLHWALSGAGELATSLQRGYAVGYHKAPKMLEPPEWSRK